MDESVGGEKRLGGGQPTHVLLIAAAPVYAGARVASDTARV